MRFVDFLRAAVLLCAGAATVLAAVTVVAAGRDADETPQQLEEQSDLLVDGPLGVRGLLMAVAS